MNFEKNKQPTHPDSAPVETILMGNDRVSNRTYWFAEPGISPIDIWIVLSSEASISKIVLIVDTLGYSKYDLPTIKFYGGLYKSKLTHLGDWNLPSEGVERNTTLVNHLKFPEQCKILKFTFKLPHVARNTDRALFSNSQAGPFLHIGRLRIFGHPIPSANTPTCTISLLLPSSFSFAFFPFMIFHPIPSFHIPFPYKEIILLFYDSRYTTTTKTRSEE